MPGCIEVSLSLGSTVMGLDPSFAGEAWMLDLLKLELQALPRTRQALSLHLKESLRRVDL